MYIGKRIRVLVVDDSIMFRTAISKSLEHDPQIQVVGTAFNAYNARDKILELKPDVITLDVEMPGMNGIEFLKLLMPQHPMPVIVVSAANGIVFEAMHNGAVDFILKPGAGDMDDFSIELAAKIKTASIARLARPAHRETLSFDKTEAFAPASLQTLAGEWDTGMLVAIGASTGGTEATSQILKLLPEGIPGMVITQHMPPVFTRMYAERLNQESRLTVLEAKDGMLIQPGYAYVGRGRCSSASGPSGF